MQPQELTPTPIKEVPLSRSPLVKVGAQVRFPPILSISDPTKVAVVQELLRDTYAYLGENQVHHVALPPGGEPNVTRDLIWRFSDDANEPRWRVSLGIGFVALETSNYSSRDDFLDRFRTVVAAVEEAFSPPEAVRLGLRYVDRLSGEAIGRIRELVRHEALGVLGPARTSSPALGDSVIHLITDAQFAAPENACIQGRWGQLPPGATYDPNVIDPHDETSWCLDFDMFTTTRRPFASAGLHAEASRFAVHLYWLFRQVVTDEFLRFYGGKP